MSSLPNNPSEATRRRNPSLYPSLGSMKQAAGIDWPPKRKIIRAQKSAEEKLNKLEAKFLAHLRTNYAGCRIGIQDIKLSIGADCRYSPDFSLWTSDGTPMELYEVKGPHVWDDAKVKIKVAATAWPMFRFFIVELSLSGWEVTEVPK